MASDDSQVQLSFVLQRQSGNPVGLIHRHDDVLEGYLFVTLRGAIDIQKVVIYFEGKHHRQPNEYGFRNLPDYSLRMKTEKLPFAASTNVTGEHNANSLLGLSRVWMAGPDVRARTAEIRVSPLRS
jgi:hypothetical protein